MLCSHLTGWMLYYIDINIDIIRRFTVDALVQIFIQTTSVIKWKATQP